MGEFAIMGKRGDTKHIWDPANEAETEAARGLFDSLVTGKGYAAYSVKGKNGERDERIRKFDPAAGRVILVPPMAGGAV